MPEVDLVIETGPMFLPMVPAPAPVGLSLPFELSTAAFMARRRERLHDRKLDENQVITSASLTKDPAQGSISLVGPLALLTRALPQVPGTIAMGFIWLG